MNLSNLKEKNDETVSLVSVDVKNKNAKAVVYKVRIYS